MLEKLLPTLFEKLALIGLRATLVLGAFIFAWLLAGWAKRATHKSLARTRLDTTLTLFFANVVRYAIIVGAALACLGAFGLQTTSFAAVLGAAGVAIGLAFQGTLSNFASGVMLLLFRPFKVGDTIRVGAHVGTVKEIELFSTELATGDNRRIILPNANIFGQPLENATHHATRRVEVALAVPMDTDLDALEKSFVEAARSVPQVLADPPPDVFVAELAGTAAPDGGAVNCQLRAWCATPHHGLVHQRILRIAKKILDDTRAGKLKSASLPK